MSLGATTHFAENWRLFGSATYDFESSLVVRDAVGFGYGDECFTYAMTLAESRDRLTRETSQSIGFNLSFRTLGDFGSNSAGFSTQ